MTLLLQPQSELGRQRRLARTLQTREHDHGRGPFGEPQQPGFAAEDGNQLLIDDLDHLLGRIQCAGEFGAAGSLFDCGNEVLDHRQIDVGFEQGDPDLTSRCVDVGFGESALAAQVLERRREAVLQGVEHECP